MTWIDKLFGKPPTRIGCDHDWEVLSATPQWKIWAEFNVSRAPVFGDRELHHRVCLKCRRVENQIDAYRQNVQLQIAKAQARKDLANEIIREATQ